MSPFSFTCAIALGTLLAYLVKWLARETRWNYAVWRSDRAAKLERLERAARRESRR